MSRPTARGQQLPPQEVELLNSLSQEILIHRISDLHKAGWALQSIGDSLFPKRIKTTIRSWVVRASDIARPQHEVLDAPIPLPKVKTPKDTKRSSPGIPEETLETIQSLAPLARSYRSRMSNSSAAAVANDRLTAICILMHKDGVSIKELAAAAGVTYRAMYKRIKL